MPQHLHHSPGSRGTRTQCCFTHFTQHRARAQKALGEGLLESCWPPRGQESPYAVGRRRGPAGGAYLGPKKLLWACGLDLFRAFFSTALKLEIQNRVVRTREGEAAAAGLGTAARIRALWQLSSCEAWACDPNRRFWKEGEESRNCAKRENGFSKVV